MFWIALALLALIAGLSVRRRRSVSAVEREPWRASLPVDEDGLDMEQIRKAEEEWDTGEEGWTEEGEDEDWR